MFEDFSVHPDLRNSGTKVSTDLGPNQLKQLRRTANHQMPQKKKEWSYTSAPFLAWFLIKYRKHLLLRLMQIIQGEISEDNAAESDVTASDDSREWFE